MVRTRRRGLAGVVASGLALAGASAGCADEPAAEVMAQGLAWAFALPGSDYQRIAGAEVFVRDRPELATTTREDGTFTLTGLPPGARVSLVLEAPGFPPSQTKIFTLPARGVLDRVTFQVPDQDLYDLLAITLEVDVDPSRCQLVTTITRVGKSLFDEGEHGEAGATAQLSPASGAERGPIYFGADVIPDPTLVESSADGGVLWTNVQPGTYRLTAQKPGVAFEEVEVDCRPGVLVNAAPPYGLQAL